MFRLRSEMQSEIQGTPFADLEKAKQEMADLKNDLRQFGRELADSAEQIVDEKQAVEMTGTPLGEPAEEASETLEDEAGQVSSKPR